MRPTESRPPRLPSGGWPLVATLAIILVGCGGGEAPEPDPIRPVRYTQVFAQGSLRERTFSGVVHAGLESRLSFKVAGTVARVPVKVGDEVETGDVLAELDRTDYQLQVRTAEASRDRARAEARAASANYDRIRALYEDGNASPADLDQARTARDATAAATQAAERQLELAELQLGYTRLTAPVAGAVAAVNSEANENVPAGTPVVVLTSGARAEVRVALPDVLITQLREGDAAVVQVDALAGRALAATVKEVGVTASDRGATFPVSVVLDDEVADVRPGMSAEVTFRFGRDDGRDRLVVPAVAVAEDREGRFVFVVRGDDDADTATVARREVEVGDLTTEGLEITAGLEDGERLVTAGVHRLTDGQAVRLLDRWRQ